MTALSHQLPAVVEFHTVLVEIRALFASLTATPPAPVSFQELDKAVSLVRDLAAGVNRVSDVVSHVGELLARVPPLGELAGPEESLKDLRETAAIYREITEQYAFGQALIDRWVHDFDSAQAERSLLARLSPELPRDLSNAAGRVLSVSERWRVGAAQVQELQREVTRLIGRLEVMLMPTEESLSAEAREALDRGLESARADIASGREPASWGPFAQYADEEPV